MVAESNSVVVEASLMTGNLLLSSSTPARSLSSVVGASGVLSPPMNLVEGIVSGCLSLEDCRDRLEDASQRPVPRSEEVEKTWEVELGGKGSGSRMPSVKGVKIAGKAVEANVLFMVGEGI